MTLRHAFRLLFAAFCIAATVLGLANVFSDNTEVESLARLVACDGAPSCEARITMLQRTPLGQKFQLHLSDPLARGSGRTVDLACSRAQILIGAYSCKLTSN
jgi:hypothetical protein